MRNAKIIFITMFSIIFLFSSCGDDVKKNPSEAENINNKEFLKNELSNGDNSIIWAAGGFRKNLLSQTVVEGTLYNDTKQSFKNVKLGFKFLNKDGLILKNESMRLDGIIPPGDTPFKDKFDYWDKNIEKITISLLNAELIN